MQQETLLTGRGGRLHARLWRDDPEPQGVVVCIHGLGDHSGRYLSVARHLTSQGWALLAFDLPGHGLSPGRRGRVDSFDGLLQDIDCARTTARERLPDRPQVVLGQSMGGNLAINYVLRRRQQPESDDLAGMILSAPMLLPPNPPRRPHVFAAWLTGQLFPWLRVGRSVDPSLLTTDPEEAIAVTGDSLMHSKITVYLATQLLAQGRWAMDHARDVTVPSLILVGEDDRLVDRAACENLPIRIGEELASQVSFPGKRHALFHESGKEDVLDCVGSWLRQFARRSR